MTYTLAKTGAEIDANLAAVGIDILNKYGSGTSRTHTTIESAKAAIGSDKVTIFLSGTWTIGANLTIPSNIHIKMLPGALFSVSDTFTLTIDSHINLQGGSGFTGSGTVKINGDVDAGLWQIFGDDLGISGSPTSMIRNIWHVEWFGAIPWAESSAAINKAISFAGDVQYDNDRRVKIIGQSSYYINSTINISDRGLSIEFVGDIIQSNAANLSKLINVTSNQDCDFKIAIDGNADNNTTNVTGILFDGGYNFTKNEYTIITKNCNNIGVHCRGNFEGADFNIQAKSCGVAFYAQEYLEGSTGRINLNLSTYACNTAIKTYGFTNINATIVSDSDDQVIYMENGGSCFLSGETEGSGSLGGNAISTVGIASPRLILNSLYVRAHKAGWVLSDTTGGVSGDIIFSGVSTTVNGALLTGSGDGRPITIDASNVGIGVQVGDSGNQTGNLTINYSGGNTIANEHILFYNARNIILNARRLNNPTDGVSHPINISDTISTDDIMINVSPGQHIYEIAKAAGSQRNRVVFLSFFTSANLSEIPNIFEGMEIPNYKYGAPSWRIETIKVGNYDQWILENYGVNAIENGNTSVTITHGLPVTPAYISLTGTSHEVKDAIVTAIGATTFNIEVADPVTANRNVYWVAKNR